MYLGSGLLQLLQQKNLSNEADLNVLARVAKGKVFNVDICEGEIYVIEECDQYHTVDLSKDDLLSISKVFKTIHDNYEELLHLEGLR